VTDVLSLALGMAVVLGITVVTGYFVAQEFAYMTVDRSALAARAEGGDATAQRALGVTRRTSFMLSGAQLGITVTGLLVGYVAEPLIGESLGTLLGGIGVPTAVGVGTGAVLALLFSTIVQMLFGELFPKNLAIARPESVARRLAASRASTQRSPWGSSGVSLPALSTTFAAWPSLGRETRTGAPFPFHSTLVRCVPRWNMT
jgi:CBS domain containing-hemolysin-like protein